MEGSSENPDLITLQIPVPYASHPAHSDPSAYPMKHCAEFDPCPLSYLMLIMVASVSAFIAWHALGNAIPEPASRAIASTLVFATVGGANLLYIRRCLERYRRHQHRYQLTGVSTPLQA